MRIYKLVGVILKILHSHQPIFEEAEDSPELTK